MGQECRLYLNAAQYLFSIVEEAKEAAKKFMPEKAALRIEYLYQTKEHDFWAYEYDNKVWLLS